MIRFLLFLVFFHMVASMACAESLRMEIDGVDKELKTILATGLVLPPGIVKNDQVNQNWLNRYQQRLPQKVKDILEPYGYFYPQINSSVSRHAEEFVLTIAVAAGEPLRVTSLDVKLSGPGETDSGLQQAVSAFPLRVGDILLQRSYEQGKSSLQQEALDRGFLDADYSAHEIRVSLEKRTAAIVLTLNTGARYRFGETRFSGEESYPDKFLRRFLSYKQGEKFSYRLLNQSQLNFINADLFKTAAVRPLLGEKKDQAVPVLVELDPMPRHQLRPGIGYGTDTGGRLSLRYRNLNLLHRGHEFKGNILLAERQQSLLSTYIIPDPRRIDSQLLLHAGINREDTDSYLSRELFGEIEYQRALSKRLSGSLFLRYSSEFSRISGEEDGSELLLPGIRLAWTAVDDPLRGRRGFQAKLTLQGSHQSAVSDTSLVQLIGQVTGLQPLSENFSLLVRLQGGTTWLDDPFDTLPASLRFFAGGDKTVRGYAYQSLGPKDEDGNVVGGQHMLAASMELERRFFKDYGVAVFYDIGNAFNSFNDYELKQGAGIGLRYYTRIGALRLDLARQIGEPKNKYRVHFSVGIGW